MKLQGFQIHSNGQVAQVPESTWIKNTLRAAFLTRIGERERHAYLGSSLQSILHRQMTSTERDELRETLMEELKISVPEVTVDRLDFLFEYGRKSQLGVTVEYRILDQDSAEKMELRLAV